MEELKIGSPAMISYAESLIPRCEEGLPNDLHGLLAKNEGGFELARKLPEAFSAQTVTAADRKPQQAWVNAGWYYLQSRRYSEACSIFTALYFHLIKAEEKSKKWYHKGIPLLWLSESYYYQRYELIWRRYLMLTLIEDAIRGEGRIDPSHGVYIRVIPRGFLSESELNRYAAEAYQCFHSGVDGAIYPEAILQRLDQGWITQAPSAPEAGVYLANTRYINHLMSALAGASDGNALERLAEYLLTCMPGCRTLRRRRSSSTDYDVVCSVEGLEMDFRSELGRYFLCECKDWSTPADFSTMAKFCRVLDSVKARFGIIFSSNGISGAGKTKNAEREQLKVFQDRGMVIAVMDRRDLTSLAKGANFITLLRNKYEKVRLDLSESEFDGRKVKRRKVEAKDTTAHAPESGSQP